MDNPTEDVTAPLAALIDPSQAFALVSLLFYVAFVAATQRLGALAGGARVALWAGLYAALAITLAYATIGTILVPRLWIDPLGPMLKIWPILVLNLIALAIHEDR